MKIIFITLMFLGGSILFVGCSSLSDRLNFPNDGKQYDLSSVKNEKEYLNTLGYKPSFTKDTYSLDIDIYNFENKRKLSNNSLLVKEYCNGKSGEIKRVDKYDVCYIDNIPKMMEYCKIDYLNSDKTSSGKQLFIQHYCTAIVKNNLSSFIDNLKNKNKNKNERLKKYQNAKYEEYKSKESQRYFENERRKEKQLEEKWERQKQEDLRYFRTTFMLSRDTICNKKNITVSEAQTCIATAKGAGRGIGVGLRQLYGDNYKEHCYKFYDISSYKRTGAAKYFLNSCLNP